MFNITANRNIQCYKTTNVKASIFTTHIMWIVFLCVFPPLVSETQSEEQTVCREASQNDGLCLSFLHI